MIIQLDNGATIEGSEKQIKETLKTLKVSLDPNTYYWSESKGLLLIEKMNTTHLRNAILKQYESWVKSLHSIRDPSVLVGKLQEGLVDKNWYALLREYYTRDPE